MQKKNFDGMMVDVEWKQTTTFNEKGLETQIKSNNGYVEVREYDKNGNFIYAYEKNSSTNPEKLISECWREYDSNNNEIHFHTSDKFEEWKEYDAKGNCIHSKDTDDVEQFFSYDERGNEIERKANSGLCSINEYDDKNNLVHSHITCEIPEGHPPYDVYYTYDQNNDLVYIKKVGQHPLFGYFDQYEKKSPYTKPQIEEEWREYDSNHHFTHIKESTGNEMWFQYNDHGDPISRKDNDEITVQIAYDEHHQESHTLEYGTEIWYENEYDSEGRLISKKEFRPKGEA